MIMARTWTLEGIRCSGWCPAELSRGGQRSRITRGDPFVLLNGYRDYDGAFMDFILDECVSRLPAIEVQ
jgi:hypothetical protein